MNILLISGEVSGDRYAAHLANTLLSDFPQTRLFGIGGDHLKHIVHEFVFESAYSHGVGIESMFFNSRFKRNLLSSLKQTLTKSRIDRVIIIDFQHYNEVIATCINSFNIPIYTFITPNFWMWKSINEAQKICHYSDSIITIFEPEYAFYKSIHPKTYYFGHPLPEMIPSVTPSTISFPPTPHITLLPGSRPQEFKLYLKKMLLTLDILYRENPGLTITLPLSSTHYKPIIQAYLKDFSHLPIHLSDEPAHEIIQKSSMVFSASGSVTLEAVLLYRPLIVVAALPPLTYFIAKYILRLKLPYISLPNFLTQTDLVPEFVQEKIQPSIIAKQAQILLKNPTQAIRNYNTLHSCLKHNGNVYKNIVSLMMR